jgi:hypothetical protein
MLVWATLLMASHLQAQVNWLTDNRYVTVTGNAQIAQQTSISNYSATATPATSFGSFGGNVSDSLDVSGPALEYGQTLTAECGSSSTATQNSSLTDNQLNFSSTVFAGTGGTGWANDQQFCYGEADTYCQLTFSVSSTQRWSLSLNPDLRTSNLSFGWDLSSALNGSILGAEKPNPDGPTPYYYGTLDTGDTYTLTIYLNTFENQPDPSEGRNSEASLDATFSVVPEPSSSGLIVMGLTGLFALRACLKIPRGAVFVKRAGWRGVTKENTLHSRY